MKPAAQTNKPRGHSDQTKKKIAASNTGKVFSQERRNNIGKSRKVKLSNENMTLLHEYWSKGYYSKTWIMKQLHLSERVYMRLLKEFCVVQQAKYLPQNLSPSVIEEIITKTKNGTPYKQIAEDLGLGEKQIRSIIMKLSNMYGIMPVSKPHIVSKEHRANLSLRLADYNRNNPKKKEQNPNWRGGTTSLSEEIRKSLKYKEWRLSVMSRDAFMCIHCNGTSVLQVDHVYPFALILEEGLITTLAEAEAYMPLWNLANGRTLCRDCHRKTETYGKQRKNYAAQSRRNNHFS